MCLKEALALALTRLKEALALGPMRVKECLALGLTRLKDCWGLGLRRKETYRRQFREPNGFLEDVRNATLVVLQQLSVESIWEFVSLRMASTHRR
jgi:hypothetical protein